MPTFGRTGSGKWHIVGPDGCRPNSNRVSVSLSLGGSTYARGRRDDQRLVLPDAIAESDSGLCESCALTLEAHQRRRSRLISGRKRVTTVRDPDWAITRRSRTT